MKNLSKKVLIEEFHEFLRENNCASKFYANLYNRKNKPWLKAYKTQGITQNTIDVSFDWESTPQGRNYWLDLLCKWESRYRSILLLYYLEKSKSK